MNDGRTAWASTSAPTDTSGLVIEYIRKIVRSSSPRPGPAASPVHEHGRSSVCYKTRHGCAEVYLHPVHGRSNSPPPPPPSPLRIRSCIVSHTVL